MRVFFREICSAERMKMPARPIDHLGFQAHRHQAQDLVLQHLAIAGAVFVPDHQVHRQPLQAPVGMGLE